jgi:lipopolysaccharide heptosyltransferase II
MRVLVVKLGALGDVIMSLTMVSALRATHPEAHLTWVVGKSARQILTLVDGIDEVICVDDVRLLKGGALGRVSEILKLWRGLLGRTFDLVITAHSDARYRLLTLPVFARARRGFGMNERAGPLPGRRHSNEYSRLVLGTDGPDVPVYPLPRVARPLAAAPYDRNSGNGMVVVMAPGGARNVMRVSPLRRWPTESYVSLASALITKGYTIVLVGGEQDSDVKPHFSSLRVVDLIGRTSLSELASAFAGADVVVTHDSLAVHMARLVRAPIVALFGPTSPLSFGPENIGEAGDAERTRVIWGGTRLPCRPCYDGKEFYTCPSNRCMSEISVSEVLEAVYEIVGSR